jgi:dTDP-4-dehydrorhamnose reductase
VHLHCHREEQIRWFNYVWQTCTKLKSEGINIRSITAWALLGSYGWNKLLRVPGGDYEPGVFDIRSGVLRKTALTDVIQKLNANEKHLHPVNDAPGWWNRDTRFFHDPVITTNFSFHDKLENMSPVLIIGKNGTLGKAFANVCSSRHINFKILGREDCDITQLDKILNAIDKFNPWSIINAAGYVRVDDAEKEFEKCFKENATGANNLSIACKANGIKLITFSTDLVFDGKKSTAYHESDITNPLNIYGRSKAEAEKLVLTNDASALVIRTSAFFSPADKYNFAYWVIDKLSNHQQIPVANDVHISPTYVPHLVHASLDLLIDNENGIWHLTNDGSITWSDFAYEIAGRAGLNNKYINALPLTDLQLMAPRPYNSVLTSEKAIILPSLENALHCFFETRESVISN